VVKLDRADYNGNDVMYTVVYTQPIYNTIQTVYTMSM